MANEKTPDSGPPVCSGIRSGRYFYRPRKPTKGTPVHVPKDQSRVLGRQAIGSLSLLLVVALALSTSMRVGRPSLPDAGRDRVPDRAAALTNQSAVRQVRRVVCEKPPVNRPGVVRPRLRLLPQSPALAGAAGVAPRHLREALLDLPPPRA